MIPILPVAVAVPTRAGVAALMRMKNISFVPVVDKQKNRRYLGTISDRDIVTRCVAAGHDPKECSAEDHVRTDTAVVTPDTELDGFRIERLDAKDTHIRSTIVVVDGTRRVIGFIPHPEQVAGVVIG